MLGIGIRMLRFGIHNCLLKNHRQRIPLNLSDFLFDLFDWLAKVEF